MKYKLCRNCKWYNALSTEHSGLKSGWTYVIGRCDNAKSVHSERDNLADWVSCWLWTQGKQKANPSPTGGVPSGAADVGGEG